MLTIARPMCMNGGPLYSKFVFTYTLSQRVRGSSHRAVDTHTEEVEGPTMVWSDASEKIFDFRPLK